MNTLLGLAGRKLVPNVLGCQSIQEIHLTCHYFKALGSSVVHREARMLKKLMTGSNKPKKKFFTVDQTSGKQFKELQFLNAFAEKKKGPTNRTVKRIRVLNTVFAEKVTSVLSTGELGDGLMDLGIYITRIQISNDFSRLQIFWDVPIKSECSADEIQQRLDKVSGRLRHVLIMMRFMGLVPPVEFKRDPVTERLAKIEEALKKVEPDLVAEEDEYETAASSLVRTEVDQDEEGTSREDFILEETVEAVLKAPEMSNHILGINHARIMSHIQDSLLRASRRKQKEPENVGSMSTVSRQEVVDTSYDPQARVKAFLDHVEQQRKDKLRLAKAASTARMERDYYLAEQIQRFQEYQDSLSYKVSSKEEDDYLDDDFQDCESMK